MTKTQVAQNEAPTQKIDKNLAWLQEEMDNLQADDFIDFRIAVDGTISQGHVKDRRTLAPTGPGHKFKIKNKNGNGLTLHNISFGWQKEVPLADNNGNVYDYVISNVVGHDFDEYYTLAEQVVKDGSQWLVVREKELQQKKRSR